MGHLPQLHTVFQPIVDLKDWTVVGHECLIRGPRGSALESPDKLFAWGRQTEQTRDLEEHCRASVWRDALEHMPRTHWTFVNVDMTHADLPLPAESLAIAPGNLVIEVSENQPIVDNKALIDQVRQWQADGFRVAIDDYGMGYMGMGALLTIKPDIVKIDRVLVRDIHASPAQQVLLKGVVEVAHVLQSTLIAEGIETTAELRYLRSHGVGLGQGFLLGSPQSSPVMTISLSFDDQPDLACER